MEERTSMDRVFPVLIDIDNESIISHLCFFLLLK